MYVCFSYYISVQYMTELQRITYSELRILVCFFYFAKFGLGNLCISRFGDLLHTVQYCMSDIKILYYTLEWPTLDFSAIFEIRGAGFSLAQKD